MIGSGLHRLRRIATPAGWQVERVWHPGALAELGADMHMEVAAQRLAAQHGLAPPVLGFDPVAGVMRMPWVEGVPLEVDWHRRDGRRAAMREILERLRGVAAGGLEALDLRERVRLLHRRLGARDAARATMHAPAVEQALAAWDAASSLGPQSGSQASSSPAAEAAPCLVHGDLTPGNILVREDGSLLLLDWEYAHAGGPWDDLAALCAAAEDDAFAGWASSVPVTEHARFAAMRGLRRTLDALWYDLAATLGAAPRDAVP
jgi:aminoglycoside phosphotransferase (APT) family kinase protein